MREDISLTRICRNENFRHKIKHERLLDSGTWDEDIEHALDLLDEREELLDNFGKRIEYCVVEDRCQNIVDVHIAEVIFRILFQLFQHALLEIRVDFASLVFRLEHIVIDFMDEHHIKYILVDLGSFLNNFSQGNAVLFHIIDLGIIDKNNDSCIFKDFSILFGVEFGISWIITNIDFQIRIISNSFRGQIKDFLQMLYGFVVLGKKKASWGLNF